MRSFKKTLIFLSDLEIEYIENNNKSGAKAILTAFTLLNNIVIPFVEFEESYFPEMVRKLDQEIADGKILYGDKKLSTLMLGAVVARPEEEYKIMGHCGCDMCGIDDELISAVEFASNKKDNASKSN